jgi:hypothetical protein
MNSDSRWYRASKSKVVRISRTDHDAYRWGVWLNERLLCDSYSSAEEAALAANRKNFDNDDAVRIFSGTYVPSDINMWQTAPPGISSVPLNEVPPTACKGRLRKSNSVRL